MITASGVSFAYSDVPALTGAGLRAEPGSVVGLIGPNGSGKTTFLRTLYAALSPTAGLITVDERDVASLRRPELARRVAVVAQEPAGELPITVSHMVLLGRSPHLSSMQRYSASDYRVAAEALHRVGARHLAERSFATLSGGERQRVLIARCLAQQTDHLLLDEPTNHLDIRYQHEILELVRTLQVSTVIVLHDLNLAARYCDRLVLLDSGRVVSEGDPSSVLRPEVLEPVYGIGVQRLCDDGVVQLLFHPLPRSAASLEETP